MASEIVPERVVGEKPRNSIQHDFADNGAKDSTAIIVIDEEEKEILRKIDLQ